MTGPTMTQDNELVSRASAIVESCTNPDCEVCRTLRDQSARIEALVAEKRSREWQPIETAPKDDPVLVYDPDSGTFVAGHDCDSWYICGSHWETSPVWPTHWMPLPEPPALKDTTDDRLGEEA